ncbi:LacI family DNA-binding transcriptional regulator, partial [Streptomyces hydrogenans]|uniref:LacI family DNA-binding transcriptional regulator n=1 Tax=Streptomyces hydrogenans TaxID=1873719 RepID=UPI003F584720
MTRARRRSAWPASRPRADPPHGVRSRGTAVTLADVAARARVSPATVSRVLN